MVVFTFTSSPFFELFCFWVMIYCTQEITLLSGVFTRVLLMIAEGFKLVHWRNCMRGLHSMSEMALFCDALPPEPVQTKVVQSVTAVDKVVVNRCYNH